MLTPGSQPLDGVGFLEHGQIKHAGDMMRGLAQVNMGHAPAKMEVAVFAIPKRRGAACGAGALARQHYSLMC